MTTLSNIYAIRRENLLKEVSKFSKKVDFCREYGVDPNHLQQMLNGPTKPRGKNIGEEFARKFEELTGKPTGSMDRRSDDQFVYDLVDLLKTLSESDLRQIHRMARVMLEERGIEYPGIVQPRRELGE